MEVDHIFICVQSGAPEAETLKKFGLTEGSSNKHPGQGTENRRFFFKNSFIELIFLNNPEEASSDLTKPTLLFERLSTQNNIASPFGICFRPKNKDDNGAKFPHWVYKPSYLPASLEVNVAKDSVVSEPMWFFLSFASRPDLAAKEKQQPLVHSKDLSEITAIKVSIPNLEQHPTSLLFNTLDNFEVTNGAEHLMEISFDHEPQGMIHDFRPELPLIFKY